MLLFSPIQTSDSLKGADETNPYTDGLCPHSFPKTKVTNFKSNYPMNLSFSAQSFSQRILAGKKIHLKSKHPHGQQQRHSVHRPASQKKPGRCPSCPRCTAGPPAPPVPHTHPPAEEGEGGGSVPALSHGASGWPPGGWRSLRANVHTALGGKPKSCITGSRRDTPPLCETPPTPPYPPPVSPAGEILVATCFLFTMSGIVGCSSQKPQLWGTQLLKIFTEET